MTDEELLDLVEVTDHGVLTMVDPDTEDEIPYRAITFTVVKDGLEYGITLSTSPHAGDATLDVMIVSGKLEVLTKAGYR